MIALMSIIRRVLGKVDPTVELLLDILIMFHAIIFFLMIGFCLYDTMRDKRLSFRSKYIEIAQQLEKEKKMTRLQMLKSKFDIFTDDISNMFILIVEWDEEI